MTLSSSMSRAAAWSSDNSNEAMLMIYLIILARIPFVSPATAYHHGRSYCFSFARLKFCQLKRTILESCGNVRKDKTLLLFIQARFTLVTSHQRILSQLQATKV